MPAIAFLQRNATLIGGLAAAVLIALGVWAVIPRSGPKPEMAAVPDDPFLRKMVQRDPALAKADNPAKRLQVLSAMAGTRNPLPVAFNVCLSNVPGPGEVLYLNGSRLEAIYPMSIPIHGMALNITLESYADTLNFGFIGDRDSVPHLQRLAVHTGAALTELEAAFAARSDVRRAEPATKTAAKKTTAKKAPARKTPAKKA